MDSTGENKPWKPKETWRRTVEREASFCRQHPQQQLTDQNGTPLPSPQAPVGAETIE
ncbi:hypothetical protein DPMN_104365 [Dreissena polymorpha]|uniref:Uncharacterized protein n=1 Tax=Dreissena polymorpha TaxID=45954 RepID=A0A9D4HBU9_DREPO|nr:hypothetical protein DPMN_104365 [Dreissena polymorpha]